MFLLPSKCCVKSTIIFSVCLQICCYNCLLIPYLWRGITGSICLLPCHQQPITNSQQPTITYKYLMCLYEIVQCFMARNVSSVMYVCMCRLGSFFQIWLPRPVVCCVDIFYLALTVFHLLCVFCVLLLIYLLLLWSCSVV